jgi:hypothetical protein
MTTFDPEASRRRSAAHRSLLGHSNRPEAAFHDGQWRNQSQSRNAMPAGGVASFEFKIERPQQDSNLRTRLRRPLLYPLSYGGLRRNSSAGRAVED